MPNLEATLEFAIAVHGTRHSLRLGSQCKLVSTSRKSPKGLRCINCNAVSTNVRATACFSQLADQTMIRQLRGLVLLGTVVFGHFLSHFVFSSLALSQYNKPVTRSV